MSDSTRPYEEDAFGPTGVLINGHRVQVTDDGYVVRTPTGGLLCAATRRGLEAIIGGGATCYAHAARTCDEKNEE